MEGIINCFIINRKRKGKAFFLKITNMKIYYFLILGFIVIVGVVFCSEMMFQKHSRAIDMEMEYALNNLQCVLDEDRSNMDTLLHLPERKDSIIVMRLLGMIDAPIKLDRSGVYLVRKDSIFYFDKVKNPDK